MEEKNHQVVVYGGIASIGILMMGIAIGNAYSAPKTRNNAQLELLKQQVAEQEIRLKRMQPSEQEVPKSK